MAKIEVNFRICVPPCRGGPDPNYERLERARGQYNTAVHQLRGDIDKKDTKAAFASMKRSADLGFAPAEVMMGVFYLEGIETAVDEKQAAEWFDRAAAQGSAKGLYELGWLHETGKGTNVDRAEALRLYLRAAEKNFPEAQCAAGILLEEGNGVPQDVDQAQKWYRKSADQGLALAQYRLAKAYWGGVFGRQDQVKAFTWALIASSGGEKRWNAAVQEYRAGMAEEQIRAAEREAARFKPHPATVTQ